MSAAETAVDSADSQAGAQQELPFAMVYGQAVMEMPWTCTFRQMRWKCSSKPSRARLTCCCT
ncbi:hypothetical protein THH46_24365 [Pseudomonas sp. NA13]